MSEVAALEDVCERAWPPRERVELDGAVLRFTHGFTRRANSARVDGGGGDLEGLIARAEHEYRSRGLRPGFRLTPLSPPAFERLLGERGYVVDTEAVVMVADALPETPAPAPATASSSRRRSARSGCASSRRSSATGRPSRIPAPAGCSAPATRRAASRSRASTASPAATGYARLEGDWLYIACVATFPEHRRRGLARAVSERLFAWGAASGARRAILQAETKNAAAQGALCAARLPAALRLPRPRARHRDRH